MDVKKFGIQIAMLLIVIFGALYLSFHRNIVNNVLPTNSMVAQSRIKIDDAVINVEVADTADKRSKGLSGRESLASDSGMLFVFPEAKKYQFWMKGMKFPLDLIFIRDGKVVDSLKNVAPPAADQKDTDLQIYEPVAPIDMMLEINTGYISSHDIHTGGQVYLVK